MYGKRITRRKCHNASVGPGSSYLSLYVILLVLGEESASPVPVSSGNLSSECEVCPCESARRDFSRRDVEAAKVFAEWEEKRRKIAPHYERMDERTFPRRRRRRRHRRSARSRSRSGRNEIPDRASVVYYRDDDLARKGIADATIYAHRLTSSSVLLPRGEWHISLDRYGCSRCDLETATRRPTTEMRTTRESALTFPRDARGKRVSSPAIAKGYHHRDERWRIRFRRSRSRTDADDLREASTARGGAVESSDAGPFSAMNDK
ncbi:Uncharacterized protein DBV15_09380 [Temnothorax longispinosus]|uniref:Uncharacterized protein n=1 Tax=Temnothorax longispinosus TaxID=300112 RepID=A0A4S2KWQ4_9HYME|nr:Uncharacterized protein DBV15_09380 [Temnothorax longispinosus]